MEETLDTILNLFDNEAIKKIGFVSFTFTKREDMDLDVIVEYENHTKRATITQEDINDENIDRRFIDYVENPTSDWKRS